MKYKFNYKGNFEKVIIELLFVNVGFVIFLGIILFFGMRGNEYYKTTYSVINLGIISYMVISLTLWINGIVNLLIVIRHTIKSIEVETNEEDKKEKSFNNTDLERTSDFNSFINKKTLLQNELKKEMNMPKKDKLVNESELIISEEILSNLKLLDEYSNLSDSKKDELKKEFEQKETWRLLKMVCTESKLEYLRRYYENI